MIKRLLFEKFYKLKKSILLVGPRQSGKSTLLKSLKPELIINLADESTFIHHSSDPDLFSSMVSGHKLIFVGEVQRIPGLLNTIQVIIDDSKMKKPILFLLSGSSARKLKKGQANLLPGRILIYNMAGLSIKELDYRVGG